MLNNTLPVRNAPFDEKPGYYPPASLWFYGNIRLLHSRLASVAGTAVLRDLIPRELDAIASEAEKLVLDGKTLVVGVHNHSHRRAAIVPLRWGSPRIVVFSGGFEHHLGKDLTKEPFKAAELWRFAWDPKTDLAVSLRAPDAKPTFATHNPTIDRLIAELVEHRRPGLSSIFDSLTPVLRE